MKSRDSEEMLDIVRNAREHLGLSAEARDRIERRLAGGAAGATTLRTVERAWPRRAAWIGAAAAVAIAGAVWLLPAVDRETTVSAAEVLGRSQEALAAPASGVEVLTYDLTLGGVLEELLPPAQAGSFTVEEAIDHDTPGRYRVLKLAPDGSTVAGGADDPVARNRVRYVRLDDRGLLFQLGNAGLPAFSIVELKRAALRGLIGMMQASDTQSVRAIDRAGEAAYEVDVPGTPAGTGLLSLQRAKAIVDRTHARLLDFDAQGTIGGRTFAITFNLRSRDVHPAGEVPADAFTIEPRPGDQIIDLRAASSAPVWDVIRQCLPK